MLRRLGQLRVGVDEELFTETESSAESAFLSRQLVKREGERTL